MAEGKRPGGLTALAVLNFVFGGLGALGTLAFFGVIALVKGAGNAIESAGGEIHSTGPGVGLYYVVLLLMAASAFLLITSGVGYIKQKRFLGRTMGTMYAVLSIGSSILSLLMLHQPFGIGTIIGLIYPVLTLILVNTTFKDDLVN